MTDFPISCRACHLQKFSTLIKGDEPSITNAVPNHSELIYDIRKGAFRLGKLYDTKNFKKSLQSKILEIITTKEKLQLLYSFSVQSTKDKFFLNISKESNSISDGLMFYFRVMELLENIRNYSTSR